MALFGIYISCNTLSPNVSLILLFYTPSVRAMDPYLNKREATSGSKNTRLVSTTRSLNMVHKSAEAKHDADGIYEMNAHHKIQTHKKNILEPAIRTIKNHRPVRTVAIV